MKAKMFPFIWPNLSITCTVLLTLQVLSMLLFVVPASAGLYEWVTNGPYGGDTRAIAIDPIYPTTLYAGLNNRGGIYKSTNGGDSWSAIGSGLMDSSSAEIYGVYSIAIDPITPTTLYAATSNGGVFKSTNGGSNWQQASNGITHLFINTIAIDPTNPNIVYAGSGDGFFRSTNGGSTWQNASNGIKDPVSDYITVYINKVIIDPKNVRTLYLGTYSGVFKSTNGGDSWAGVNIGLTDTHVKALAIDPNNTNILYAGVGDGVFKSSNGGGSWRPVNTGLPAIPPYPINSTIVKVDPVHSDTIYTLINAGLFTSSNGGDTWSQLTSDARVNELEIDPTTPNTLYMGTCGEGISKSIDNGKSWYLKKVGISGSITTSVVQDPTVPTKIYAADNGKGVLKSTNGGVSWSSIATGLSSKSVLSLVINSAAPSTLYAGTTTGVFRTTNSGENWSLVADIGVVRAMAIDMVIPSTVYAATDYGIYKSTNNGDVWSKVSIDFPDAFINVLAIDPGNSHNVYAGTQLGVLKSTNGGANWSQMYRGMKDPSLFLAVYSIAIDPIDTGTIYAASERGVYKSTTGGDSWISSNNGPYFSALVIDPANRKTLYATARHDFWVSTNGGDSWYKIPTNQTNGWGMSSLSIASASPNIYAGANGGGVNSITLANATTTVAKPREAAYVSPQNVYLFANKPATVYYTTDGSDPTISQTRQKSSALIPILSNTTIKFYAVEPDGTAGTQSVANYVIDAVSPTTTLFSNVANAWSNNVSLACSDGTGSGCATTYYCLGTNCAPTNVYSGPILISSTTDLRYYSSDIAGNRESVKTEQYKLGTAPGAPTGVSATGGAGQATVSFTAPTENGGFPITSYVVTSSPGNISATGTGSPIVVNGLSNGTAYTFTVKALNVVGAGDSSTASNSVTPKASQSIGTITFNPSSLGAGGTVTASATATSGLAVSFSSATPTICMVNGSTVTALTIGTCTIAADQTGNVNYSHSSQITKDITVNATVPEAPTGVVAVPGNTQATVSFAAPFNGGNAITSYTVTATPGGIAGSGASSPITVTGLANGTAYTFTVTATNNIGTGAASSPSASVTPNEVATSVGSPSAKFVKTGATVTFTVTYTAAQAVTLTAADVTLNKTGDANGKVSVSGTGTATRAVTIGDLTGNGTLGITIAGGTATAGTIYSLPSASSETFRVDNQPPVLTVETLGNDVITSHNTLTVAGTVTDACDVGSVKVNGTAVTVTNGAFNTAVTLQEGSNPIEVVALDAVGNSTANTRSVVYDSTAPVITAIAPTPAAGSFTKQSAAVITGTISEAGTVTIFMNGATPVNATMNETGTQFTTDITLTLGKNTISVTAYDAVADGTRNSSTVERIVTFDNNTPEAAVTDPANDITTTLKSYPVKGTVSDQTSNTSIVFAVDGAAVSPAPTVTSGGFTQTVSLSEAKAYAITVTATDEAGNSSTAHRNIIYHPVLLVDALRALRIAVGLVPLTEQDKVLDVAPLLAGKPAPDNVIDISDAIVLLQRKVGLLEW